MKTHSINNFINVTRSGLYCAAGDFYLDPSRPVHKAVVTHAHADHATRNSGNIYCTRPTKLLMCSRYRDKLLSHFQDVDYRQSISMNEVTVTVFPAGHMLGSCQVLMEYHGMRYLYTGDFKTQADASAETFETVQADVLITETTFADPAVSHPHVTEEIQRINAIDSQVIIGAYVMGKAQRITQLLNLHCPNRRIFVHPEISRYHSIYHQSGKDLGEWSHYRRKEFFSTPGSIYITPPSELKRYSRKEGVYRMFATGWKKSWYTCDSILQISDHADWNDLLSMIRIVKPKMIYTLHGDGTHLKNHLQDSGIDVQILDH